MNRHRHRQPPAGVSCLHVRTPLTLLSFVTFALFKLFCRLLRPVHLIFCRENLKVSRSRNKNFRAVTSPENEQKTCFSTLTTRKYLKLEIEIQLASSISESSG